MSALSKDLRTQLGHVIKEARRAGEAGALKALKSLAVERHEPYASMSPAEKALRNRLRARSRQLGDIRDKQRGNHQQPDLLHARAEFWLIRRCCLLIHFTAAHKIRANDT